MNHYPDSRNGGIENVTRLLSEQLKDKGYVIHVRFLYPSPFDHSDNSLFESCKYVTPTHVGDEVGALVRQEGIGIIVNRCVIFASPIIREALAGKECRLITTYNNKPTLDVRKIRELWADHKLGILAKFGVTLAYPWYKRRSIQHLKLKHQRSYEASDNTVLLSTQYIPEYAEIYGVGTDKMVVINNPLKSGVSISDADFARKEKTVLMVTRLDEKQKCVIKALEVWMKLCRRYSDWKLQIVGSGPDEAKIKAFSISENIHNVEFIPACNPAEYYRKASLFLMTSRNEGWPNTLNEAMRYGCVPVVLATFSAIYDMIDHGVNGYIVETGTDDMDVLRLVDAVGSVMPDSQRLSNVARAAIKKTEHLSIENIIPQWEMLFEG